MDMKINSQLIKKLREERAWSQEQLAQIAGISLRTVQRAEREGNASHESRMALAAAFGMPVNELSLPEPAPKAQPEINAYLMKRRWGIYLIVCSLMFLLDYMQGGTIGWARWPAIIWGSILLLKSFFSRRLAR